MALRRKTTMYAWIDIEATGLDTTSNQMLEFAMVITDHDLCSISRFHSVVSHNEETIRSMSTWCQNHHTVATAPHQTSLADECLRSGRSIATIEAEATTLIRNSQAKVGRRHNCDVDVVLAGSSVAFDRDMLRRHMPSVEAMLHYRVLDVSVVLQCVREWGPALLPQQPRNTTTHRAMDDITSSLALMHFYKRWLFQTPYNLHFPVMGGTEKPKRRRRAFPQRAMAPSHKTPRRLAVVAL